MTFGEIINNLALAAGVPSDDGDLKIFLSNASISNAAIPETLVKALNGNLLTIESAKAHPELNKHFRANFYDGIDAETNTTLKELGYYDKLKPLFDSEKSTPKKITLALREIAKIEQSKHSGGKEETKELQEKLNTLTKQINEFNNVKATELEAALKTQKSDYDSRFEKMALNNYFSTKKLANPLGVDADILIQIAQSKTDKAISERGWIKSLSDNGFILLTKEGTDVYEGTKKVNFNDFVDKTLTEAKLLEIGGQSIPTNNQSQGMATPTVNGQKMSKFALAAAEAVANAPSIT